MIAIFFSEHKKSLKNSQETCQELVKRPLRDMQKVVKMPTTIDGWYLVETSKSAREVSGGDQKVLKRWSRAN